MNKIDIFCRITASKAELEAGFKEFNLDKRKTTTRANYQLELQNAPLPYNLTSYYCHTYQVSQKDKFIIEISFPLLIGIFLQHNIKILNGSKNPFTISDLMTLTLIHTEYSHCQKLIQI